MNHRIEIAIPKPCHEDWRKFTPTAQGGFCQACQKEVIDFTQWTDNSIALYFDKAQGNTCGRFRESQLKRFSPNQTANNRWPLAAMLTLAALGLNKPLEAKAPKLSQSVEQRDSWLKLIQSDTLMEKIIITGVVMDQDSAAFPGVNIMQKGTSNGVVSDADGKFMLVINKPAYVETIQFFFIGMVTQEIEVEALQSSKSIVVKLHSDNLTLGGAAVVAGGIVGYRKFSPRWFWWKVRSVFSKNY